MDLKAYAREAGKIRTTLTNKVKAWRVFDVTDIGTEPVCPAGPQQTGQLILGHPTDPLRRVSFGP